MKHFTIMFDSVLLNKYAVITFVWDFNTVTTQHNTPLNSRSSNCFQLYFSSSKWNHYRKICHQKFSKSLIHGWVRILVFVLLFVCERQRKTMMAVCFVYRNTTHFPTYNEYIFIMSSLYVQLDSRS